MQIGELGAQGVQIAQVRRGFQHPTLGRSAACLAFLPLQELQHPVQIGICGREIPAVEPGPVARHIGSGLRNVGQERVGQEHDLFLGLAGVHRVDGEQLRRQVSGDRFALLADRDARIRTAGPRVVEPGSDLDHLPAVGAVKTFVRGQKALQQGRTAAHHPGDHHGRNDDLLGDLGVSADPLLRAQPHPQAVDQTRSQDVHAHVVERRARVTVGQHLQRLGERQWPPVVEALLLLRSGHQLRSVEGVPHRVRISGAGWCRRSGRRTWSGCRTTTRRPRGGRCHGSGR